MTSWANLWSAESMVSLYKTPVEVEEVAEESLRSTMAWMPRELVEMQMLWYSMRIMSEARLLGSWVSFC